MAGGAVLVHGVPPHALASVSDESVQVSPLHPGATLLDDIAPESAAALTMVVPPGTIERRHTLAQALRVLAPGGTLLAMGPKDKGGARIRKELEGFGCTVAEESRQHWRLCTARRPDRTLGLEEAVEAGAMRFEPSLGLWTQPGVFSWDRIDEGSALLLEALGPLEGHGADLGCGLGLLSRAALMDNVGISRIEAVDIDARAIAAARRNVDDERISFCWADVRAGLADRGLDFVLMNPPFHSGGADDVGLGRAFLRTARALLRKGGALWMVANRHLPYEADLAAMFRSVSTVQESPRFKIVRANA